MHKTKNALKKVQPSNLYQKIGHTMNIVWWNKPVMNIPLKAPIADLYMFMLKDEKKDGEEDSFCRRLLFADYFIRYLY